MFNIVNKKYRIVILLIIFFTRRILLKSKSNGVSANTKTIENMWNYLLGFVKIEVETNLIIFSQMIQNS